MTKLIGKISSNNLKGSIQGISIPADEFLEENYIETFSGDLFKKDSSCRLINSADWNTLNNKIIFDSYDTYNISNLSTISQFNLTSYGSFQGPFDFTINSAGTILLTSEGDIIKKFTMSTPYDLTTLSYSNNYLDLALGLSNNIIKCYFNDEGTKLIVIWTYTYFSYNVVLVSFNLQTPFDLSSADLWNTENSYIDMYSVDFQGNAIANLNSNGTTVYIRDSGTSDYRLYKSELLTAYDITTIQELEEIYYIPIESYIPFNLDFTKVYTLNYATKNLIESSGVTNTSLNTIIHSNSFCRNLSGTNNEYKHVTLYANGTNLDDITFYIGENNNSTITYTELPTTGNTTTRKSQRVALNNTNKYGLNWKALGAKGSEIKKLQITYEKE